MMQNSTVVGVVTGCLLALANGTARGDVETLNDFLSDPARIRDVKTMGLVIVSQVDPVVGPKNARELRRNFYAQQPRAGLTPEAAEAATKVFEHDLAEVAKVIQDRAMDKLAFVGMDLVLAKKAQDWYFGYTTGRGPVLIRMSVQYNDDVPLTIHGVQVWTKWDDVKAVTRAIQMPATDKMLTVTYESTGAQPATPVGPHP